MPGKVPEPVSGEYHGLVASQLPEANERMNVRELFKKSAPALERSRYIHVHSKPLPLSATEAHMTKVEPPNAIYCGEVDVPPTFHERCVVVIHGVVEIGVESIRELVNKLLCATETGGFADLVVIMC